MTLIHHLTSMSVAYSALHQTLKTDPKISNIIYQILTTNDREQY